MTLLWLVLPGVAVVILVVGLQLHRRHRSRSLRKASALGNRYRELSPRVKPWDIAVSYSGRDSERISPMVDLLSSAGLRVFDYQDESVVPGVLGRRLGEVLKGVYGAESEVIVAFWSPSYFKSEITEDELATAIRQDPEGTDRFLLPVLIRSVRLDRELSAIVHLDARRQSPEETVFRILGTLIDRLERQQADHGKGADG